MDTSKKQWEEEYLNSQVDNCPWCGMFRPDHFCDNCYVEMTTENCWKYEGFCGEKCFKYIREELPRKREEKEKRGIKCTCDDPSCYMCIGVTCQDDNCPTHPLLVKHLARKNQEKST